MKDVTKLNSQFNILLSNANISKLQISQFSELKKNFLNPSNNLNVLQAKNKKKLMEN